MAEGEDSGTGPPDGSPERTPPETAGNDPPGTERAEGRGGVLVERVRAPDGSSSGLGVGPGGLRLFLAGHGLRARLTAGQWRDLAARALAVAEHLEAEGRLLEAGSGEEPPPADDRAGDEFEETLEERQERLMLISREWRDLHDWRDPHERNMCAGAVPLSPEDQVRLWVLTATGTEHCAAVFDHLAVMSTGRASFQAEILRLAAAGIVETLQGSMPRAFQAKTRAKAGLRKKSPRATTMLERVGIAYAAAYYRTIKDDLFTDKHPNKTVQERYDVEDGSVRLWWKSDPGERYEELRERLLSVTGPDEQQVRALRREAAQEMLTEAGHLYKRRVL